MPTVGFAWSPRTEVLTYDEALGDGDIQVATRHRDGPHDRLLRRSDLGFGASRQAYSSAASNISCCIAEPFFSDHSSIVERPFK